MAFNAGLVSYSPVVQGWCQIRLDLAWDHIFLGLFWMYNAVSVVVFHFSWKIQSDVWANEAGGGIRQLRLRLYILRRSSRTRDLLSGINGRVVNTWADILNRANLGFEVMHERNAHNFPLDLA